MNVTSKGRYALRVMLDLARHREDGFISLKTVADRQEISQKYLEAIISALKKEGLVESSRGKEGGYRIAKEPSDCTAGEVLRCLEDSLAPVPCVREDAAGCERAGLCLTLPMWKELDAITNAYLDSVHLSDLLTGARWRE